jgi:hypothetical protein
VQKGLRDFRECGVGAVIESAWREGKGAWDERRLRRREQRLVLLLGLDESILEEVCV